MKISVHIAAAVFLTLSCFAMKAESAVFRIEPSVLVSEEYNDNIFLRRNHDRIEAFITRFAPSIHIKYTTAFWDWDINYTYNYYYYAGQRLQDDQSHLLVLRNRTEVIKDYFFVEVRDDYGRMSENVAVDYTQQSPLANQVDQNIFTVNPYLVLRPSLNSRLLFGYIYKNIHYLNASVDNQVYNVNRVDNIGYGDVEINLSSRLTFTIGGRFTQDRNSVENYNEVDVYAGPQYTYAENSYLYARGGKSWFEFEHNRHSRRDYWFWDAGITHRISTATLALGTRRSIIQDPERVLTMQDRYTVTITNVTQRSVLTLGAGLYEFRDAMIDQRISTSRQVQSTLLYRLTPTTNGTLGATYQDLDERLPASGVTKIILATFRLDQQLSEKTTLSFVYNNVNSHSYDIDRNNYYNNRYIVEFRKVF